MRDFNYAELQRRMREIRDLAAAAERDLVPHSTEPLFKPTSAVKKASVIVDVEMEDGSGFRQVFYMDPTGMNVQQSRARPITPGAPPGVPHLTVTGVYVNSEHKPKGGTV